MIVYEFWLREQFKGQAFEILGNNFKKVTPIVYAISRNPRTHWFQLLFPDDTPQPTITVIEAIINGLKDDEPFRKYVDDLENSVPIETPKYFTLERVLRVRQRQKDGTLGRIEDA